MREEARVCYHDLSNLLRVVAVQVKPEGHHLPVVSFQLTLGHSVSSAGNLLVVVMLVTARLNKKGRGGESRSNSDSYAEDVQFGLGDLFVA